MLFACLQMSLSDLLFLFFYTFWQVSIVLEMARSEVVFQALVKT